MTVEKIATYLQDRNGVFFQPNETEPFTGIYVTNFKNGQKKYEGHFKDGNRDGFQTDWFKNGQKSHEGHFKNGKKDGLHTEWFENGQLNLRKHYEKGEITNQTAYHN